MEKIKNQIKEKPLTVAYIIIFVALLVLCFLFPYTGDDWAWGSSIGIERLNNWFDNYSGRYVGNLIVLALTRSNLLKTVVMAGTLTGIIVLINKITGEQKSALWIITILLVFMPVGILKQAIVWTSGFANYSTSIFLILIYLYYVRKIYEKEKPKYSVWGAVPILALGFASALIVEHVTIYAVLLSVYVIVFTVVKFKKVYFTHIAYFLGTVAGTALMFSNSVYSSVANGSDGYRTIGGSESVSIIDKALKAYLDTISFEGFFKNFVLNFILAAVCVMVWHCLKSKLSSVAKNCGKLSLIVIVMYAGFSLMFGVGRLSVDARYKLLVGFATAVYILAMFVFLIVLPLPSNKKAVLLFYYISTGCLIAPLLVVTPIGSRCFFASMIVMILLILELFSNVGEEERKGVLKFSKSFIIVTAVGFLYLLYVYSSIYVADVHRVEKARVDAQTQTVIKVKKLPYSDYVWCSDLQNDEWKYRFKTFHGINEDAKIKVVERNK